MSGADLIGHLTNALCRVIFVAVARSTLRERTRASLNTTLLLGAIASVIAGTISTSFNSWPTRRDRARWARHYEELSSANREFSEATRAKSEFLANMSHEPE